MKTIILSFLLLAFFFSSLSAFGQSIVITPKKNVYTRKGRDVEKEKRTFEIRYPVVSGSISPAVKRKLENTISYWRVFETTLKESMEETYLSSLDYKINYNKNGILDISLIQEGVGAYPSTQTANLVVDLKTGERAKFDDVFNRNSRARLANLVDKKLQTEKVKIIKDINANKYDNGEGNKEEKETAKQMVNELKFTPENFNEFSVSDKGMTILYDAGFPHVVLALQPDGRYFFSWMQLKPFVKSDGLLGKFIR